MPRVIERQFPDASQIGIASLVVINQSRVTFTGQRGVVMMGWTARLENGGAVASSLVGIEVFGTALAGVADHGPKGWFDAVANRNQQGFIWLTVVDPAVGSFMEARVILAAGTVDVIANAGHLVMLSFGHDAAEGPTVTVE